MRAYLTATLALGLLACPAQALVPLPVTYLRCAMDPTLVSPATLSLDVDGAETAILSLDVDGAETVENVKRQIYEYQQEQYVPGGCSYPVDYVYQRLILKDPSAAGGYQELDDGTSLSDYDQDGSSWRNGLHLVLPGNLLVVPVAATQPPVFLHRREGGGPGTDDTISQLQQNYNVEVLEVPVNQQRFLYKAPHENSVELKGDVTLENTVQEFGMSFEYTGNILSLYNSTADFSIDWSAGFMQASREATVRPGDKLTFTWSESHNVYKMKDKAAFDACDFTEATDLGSASPVTHTMGSATEYFAAEGYCTDGRKLTAVISWKLPIVYWSDVGGISTPAILSLDVDGIACYNDRWDSTPTLCKLTDTVDNVKQQINEYKLALEDGRDWPVADQQLIFRDPRAAGGYQELDGSSTLADYATALASWQAAHASYNGNNRKLLQAYMAGDVPMLLQLVLPSQLIVVPAEAGPNFVLNLLPHHTISDLKQQYYDARWTACIHMDQDFGGRETLKNGGVCDYAPVLLYITTNAGYRPYWLDAAKVEVDPLLHSEDQCRQRCDADASCATFSYSKRQLDGDDFHQCYLKTAYTRELISGFMFRPQSRVAELEEGDKARQWAEEQAAAAEAKVGRLQSQIAKLEEARQLAEEQATAAKSSLAATVKELESERAALDALSKLKSTKQEQSEEVIRLEQELAGAKAGQQAASDDATKLAEALDRLRELEGQLSSAQVEHESLKGTANEAPVKNKLLEGVKKCSHVKSLYDKNECCGEEDKYLDPKIDV